MYNEKRNPPWYVYVLCVSVFVITVFQDQLKQYNLILPLVVMIFATVFGVILWKGIKEWQKSDEEILCAYQPFYLSAPENQKSGNLSAIQAIFGFVAFLIIVFLRIRGVSLPVIGVIGIMAASVWFSPVVANQLKKRSPRETATKRTPWITGREIAAFLVGLIPSAFICIFIGRLLPQRVVVYTSSRTDFPVFPFPSAGCCCSYRGPQSP